MSFIVSIGPYGGFYPHISASAWRLCLGWVAFTVIFKDIDPVLDAA